MEKNIVNIIWADDDIDSILDDICIGDLKSKGFKVVGKAHDGVELKHLLDSSVNANAVIVDANFCEEGIPENDELVSTGFEYARFLQRERNMRVPFFLFTGRSESILREKYKLLGSNALDDFPRHVRWFSKTITAEFDMMFDAIRSEVERIQSPEFIISNRYCNELKAAAFLGKDCEAKILKLLTQDYENTLAENDDPFNSLRKILERVFQVLKRYAIIPPYKRINEIASYLLFNNPSKKSEDFDKYVSLKKNILPKPLASEVYSMTKLLQDGNHDAGDDLEDCANSDSAKCSEGALEYEVDKYWRNTKDTSFFKAMLWTMIGLIHWTYDICMKHPNVEENREQIWCECSSH